MTPRIGTVIVSRGMEGMLSACLHALDAALAAVSARSAHPVVVVDNASPEPYDEARYAPREVGLVRFDAHRGFADACNAGASRLDASLLCFLNNDVLLHPRALAEMVRLLEREPSVGIVGTRMVFPDDTVQHCGVVFGSGKIGPFHCHRGSPSAVLDRETREYQAVTGACLMIRSSLFRELGGFDRSYPFGLEDIDLCLRARQSGSRVLCSNAVDSLHFESLTPGRAELDRPSRKLFMERWSGRYTIDAPSRRDEA